ncbi:MAG: MarR family transcriptional regulator [Cenarchaeum sp. SB0662_bin_33]|nr:MarR family transcriptional regulator [Cenarchaeum sp. SB0662_bin_33]
MGKLSDIYTAYKRSLDQAQDDYEETIKARSASSGDFYDRFFKNLTVNLGSRLENDTFRDGIIDEINRFFGKYDLNFIAVDGSCHKHNSSEFISFYGGAYGAKGMLRLSEDPPKIEYKRWEIEKDVSMVAFVPIPYSQISEVEVDDEDHEETFAISESDKIELTSIHLPIMQLAEVFLAYNSATSSNLDKPDLILIDSSLSGMLGYTDFGPDGVRLVGRTMPDGRAFSREDVAVAQAHPFNKTLGIPSTKAFSLKFAVIRFLHDHPGMNHVAVSDLASHLEVDQVRLTNQIKNMEKNGVVELNGQDVLVRTDPYRSWEQTKSMFQTICKGIFLDKVENALKYRIQNDDGLDVMRWMSPDDIKFLIAIGLRALIEVCWEKKILLTGIVKDSASRYLTKNYLGVCKLFGEYPELSDMSFGPLPPTDRLFCEILPYLDDGLNNPWGTIEFDSTFMTLRIEKKDGVSKFGGTFGGITRPERLFLRSIAQFYTRRNDVNLLTGHAIFIDRLAFPEWDTKSDTVQIDDRAVGSMRPLFYPYSSTINKGQLVTYFLLDQVTKNHFAEVIGYPDPLHKADQGAKSMRDNVKKLLESSELKFRSRPLTNTLREIRQEMGR